ASGSKVTTDPVELGPDPFELLLQRDVAFVGHRGADGTACVSRSCCGSRRLRAVTALELLAAAAPARVVAPDLLVRRRLHRLLHRRGRQTRGARGDGGPGAGR